MMSKMPLLCTAALAATIAAGIAAPAGAGENAVPNFTSADFGWQPNGGFDFRPVEGKVAPVGADPRPRGVTSKGEPIRERMSDAENPNLTPWAAAQARMHNDLVRN